MPSNHFSAGMMWRENPETRGIEFLVIQYQEKNHSPTIKFPGGTNRQSREPLVLRDETPVQTLAREWKDEVGQFLRSAGNNPVKFQKGEHTQFFFLLDGDDVDRGAVRTELLVEEEDGRPKEILGPPQWVPVFRLLVSMKGSHLLALEEAVKVLSPKILEDQKVESSSA